MTPTEHVAQLRKGVLELGILALLRRGESYGGALVQELESRPGLESSAGTVYPLLARLAKGHLVETSWRESPSGPPRKYYRLTPSGRRELAAMTQSWGALVNALNALLEEDLP